MNQSFQVLCEVDFCCHHVKEGRRNIWLHPYNNNCHNLLKKKDRTYHQYQNAFRSSSCFVISRKGYFRILQAVLKGTLLFYFGISCWLFSHDFLCDSFFLIVERQAGIEQGTMMCSFREIPSRTGQLCFILLELGCRFLSQCQVSK